jgi:hypothetical protein
VLHNAFPEHKPLIIKKIGHRARVDLPIFHHKIDLMIPTQADAAAECDMFGGIEKQAAL